MIRYQILIPIITMAAVTMSHGQTPIDIEEHINRLIRQGDESENQTYYEILLHYYQNPININNTNEPELARLNLLTREQIDGIIKHRRTTGPFNSILELQSVSSLDLATIKAILPFITVRRKSTAKEAIKSAFSSPSNSILSSFSRVTETRAGYANGSYLGNPDQAQMRIRIRDPGRLSLGITNQKDPGEPYFSSGHFPGIDFFSGHLFYWGQGFVRQVAVGDFKVQAGQGLVFGSGFLVGKNASTVSTVRQGSLGLLPYSSTTEYNFFRGVGLSLRVRPNLNFTNFYSNKFIDATQEDSSPDKFVFSIRKTGLHRSSAERRQMKNLNQQVFGSVLEYSTRQLKTGVTMAHTKFNKSIEPTPTSYNQFFFHGQNSTIVSWFGDVTINNLSLFGEIAKNIHSGLAWTGGLVAALSQRIDVSMLVRSLDKDFHSFYGLAFTERTALNNEQGIYWGLTLKPKVRWQLSAYYDMYRFPWLTSTTATPSIGNDYLIRLMNEASDHFQWFIQIRSEKNQKKTDHTGLPISIDNQVTKSALNLKWIVNDGLNARARLQWNRAEEEQVTNGFLGYLEINPQWKKMSISSRILYFNTEDFNSRQFAYEKDILFSFNTQSFSGSGFRYYFFTSVRPMKAITLRIKWSQTYFSDRSIIGSGNDRIKGNHMSKITLQVKYTL